jgi:hypothetical protein
MSIEYSQLAQSRLTNTTATSIYSPSSGETVQIFIKIVNTTSSAVAVRVFHDADGTTYDQTTALVWDTSIEPGEFLEIDKIFMSSSSGNLAYRTATGSALTATVYGIVKS